MRSFFSQPHAAATPCLALVTLVPTLALSLGTQAHRTSRAGVVIGEVAGVRCVSHGESAGDGPDGLLPENNAA